MAGGSGERFWPLSRALRPKQFLPLGEEGRSYLWEACERLRGLIGADQIWVATQLDMAPMVLADVPFVLPEKIIAEPVKRNTGGAVVWSTAHLIASGAPMTSVISTVSADHRIRPTSGFANTFKKATECARKTHGLVTLGIKPNRPDTGYGYIELSASEDQHDWVKVTKFHEKPSPEEAKRYVDSGQFLWNSGTFFWTLEALYHELEKNAPTHFEAVHRIAADLGAGRIEAAAAVFQDLPSISIDHALLERSDNVYVVQSEFEWDDVGSWEALSRALESDPEFNRLIGDAHAVDASGNLVFNESGSQAVFLLGVHDLTVVVTHDAILVCPLDRSQDVRKVVQLAREKSPDKL